VNVPSQNGAALVSRHGNRVFLLRGDETELVSFITALILIKKGIGARLERDPDIPDELVLRLSTDD
jgi:hypothetical protein